jgi:glycosyltransferase involved in cell wall biosynthesis
LSDDLLADVMQRALVVIIPSRIESIPLILGQAARFAHNIIVTNVGDMGTLASKYQAASVCEPDIDSIYNSLIEVLKCEKDIFEHGRKKLSNLLSLKNSVNTYLKWIVSDIE